MTEKQLKMVQIRELLEDITDILVSKFFDLDSEELLDLKISVLTLLKNGVPAQDSAEYDSILQLYPADDAMWD